MSGARYLGIVLAKLTTQDVVLTVVKGHLFGRHHRDHPELSRGSSVRRGPTEIPQAVIRGTVGSHRADLRPLRDHRGRCCRDDGPAGIR